MCVCVCVCVPGHPTKRQPRIIVRALLVSGGAQQGHEARALRNTSEATPLFRSGRHAVDLTPRHQIEARPVEHGLEDLHVLRRVAARDGGTRPRRAL